MSDLAHQISPWHDGIEQHQHASGFHQMGFKDFFQFITSRLSRLWGRICLCSDRKSIMTDRAKGVRVVIMHTPHMITWFVPPICCSFHGNCAWELNWNRSKKDCNKKCHFLAFEPLLWSDTGCCKRSTSTERRSVDLRWTFAAIAQWHSRRCSRNMPSTMKQSAWPFLSQCRQWLQIWAKQSQSWLKVSLKSYVPFASLCLMSSSYPPIITVKPSGHCTHLPRRPPCCSGAFHLWDMSCCSPCLVNTVARPFKRT